MCEGSKKQWNGKYPIFIEWTDPVNWIQFELIQNEAQLIEFCNTHRLNPCELTYLEARPVYACEGIWVDADNLRYKGELDEEVQKLIDEFEQKLRAIERPIVYTPLNIRLAVSATQLEDWHMKLNLG